MRAGYLLIVALVALGPSLSIAQSAPRMARVGWISVAAPEDRESSPFLEAFRQGLRDLGYVEGRTLAIEARWARGEPQRLPELTRDLIGLGVDVIVVQGAAIGGVRRVPGAVPVVFAMSADPILAGFVNTLARPGGRFTGATFMSYEANAKRLDLVKEALPRVSRVALLSNPEHAGEHIELEESQKAARALGLKLQYVPVRSSSELEPAFAAMASGDAEAIVVLPDALVMQHRLRIVEFAAKRGIAAISGWAAFARSGGLMTYGPNLRESYRGLARHVDRILKGTSPADLPVEQPNRFELVVNLKAAKALGITIPPSILVRADEVLE